jgi:hypothetical protein
MPQNADHFPALAFVAIAPGRWWRCRLGPRLNPACAHPPSATLASSLAMTTPGLWTV